MPRGWTLPALQPLLLCCLADHTVCIPETPGLSRASMCRAASRAFSSLGQPDILWLAKSQSLARSWPPGAGRTVPGRLSPPRHGEPQRAGHAVGARQGLHADPSMACLEGEDPDTVQRPRMGWGLPMLHQEGRVAPAAGRSPGACERTDRMTFGVSWCETATTAPHPGGCVRLRAGAPRPRGGRGAGLTGSTSGWESGSWPRMWLAGL